MQYLLSVDRNRQVFIIIARFVIKEETMSYKKIVIIAVFFITHVMLCNSTYCERQDS